MSVAGRVSSVFAHISVAGALRCACVASTPGVGAVDAVGEQPIAHAHRAAVARDAPDVQVRPRRRQRPPGAVGDLQLEDVLGELVQRVAARRAAAHVDVERIGRDVAEDHLDVDDVPHVVGEGQAVVDGGLGPGQT